VARWIVSLSFVRRMYAPSDVVDELCKMGLVTCSPGTSGTMVDCAQLTKRTSDKALPPVLHHVSKAWDSRDLKPNVVTRAVLKPPGCVPAFIGRGGCNIKVLLEKLTKQLHSLVGVSGSPVTLTVHSNFFGLHAQGPPEKEFDVAMDSLADSLKEHCTQLQHNRLRASQARRERLQQMRSEQGRDYHMQLRIERTEKRYMPSALKALTLPDTSVDGIGENIIQRVGGGSAPFGQKAYGRWRRRMFLRKKRQQLLHACDALEPVPASAATAEAWQEDMPAGGRIREKCQQLVGSSHLEQLCTSGRLQFKEQARCKQFHGPVGQLQRNLATVAEVTGHMAPDFVKPIHKNPKARKTHQPSRHEKACRRNLALEINEDL